MGYRGSSCEKAWGDAQQLRQGGLELPILDPGHGATKTYLFGLGCS